MSGKRANDNGSSFESRVGAILRGHGMKYGSQYRTGICGIDGAEIVADFRVYRAVGFERGFYVECKWQSSTGSAAQKVALVADNIDKRYDRPVIVVIGGNESDVMRRILESEAGLNMIGVMDIGQLDNWCHGKGYDSTVTIVSQGNHPEQSTLFHT